VEIIYSKIASNKILHIVHREQEFYNLEKGHRKDLVDVKEFIQLSAMKMKKGQTFKPHQHIWKDGEKRVVTQESWIVIKGSVKCSFFDTDGSLLIEPILNAGDCSITLGGGHTYTILEENTLVYEFKTGPYKGAQNDKAFLGEN
tara:strand:- start:158 stop:589 length:432 start_codon:yes stop_codon:yes gene_type:complete